MELIFNINSCVTIYPSESGFSKIREILRREYDDNYIDAYIAEKTTSDNGFKEQMWVIMSDFGELFFDGSDYLSTTHIKLSELQK